MLSTKPELSPAWLSAVQQALQAMLLLHLALCGKWQKMTTGSLELWAGLLRMCSHLAAQRDSLSCLTESSSKGSAPPAVDAGAAADM